MDNPTTLLVAIMYVTIVATGLVTVLMTLSDIVGGQRKIDPLHATWIVLLLISYFGFFWETTAILELEGWNFLSFIGFIAGPVVMLFATNLICTPPDPAQDTTLGDFYMAQSTRFFAMQCLVQVWIIGLDVVFETISFDTYLTAGIGVLFVVLTLSNNHRVHVGGALIVSAAFVARMALQAL